MNQNWSPEVLKKPISYPASADLWILGTWCLSVCEENIFALFVLAVGAEDIKRLGPAICLEIAK